MTFDVLPFIASKNSILLYFFYDLLGNGLNIYLTIKN